MKYIFLATGFIAFVIFGIFLGVSYERDVNNYKQAIRQYDNAELEYLIVNMHVAKQSHQYYLDNWSYYQPLDYNTQKDWVIIYGKIIEVLEELR